MRSVIYFVMSVLLYETMALCCEVQAQQWQWLGPDSVEVDYVYAKRDTVYVAIRTVEGEYPNTHFAGAILRRINSTARWDTVSRQLPPKIFRDLALTDIGAFAVDPRNSRVLYASVHGLLYKTENAGESWQLLSDTVSHILEGVRYIGVSPHNSLVVFATDGTGFAGQLDDLYRSTDGGKSWTFVGGDFAYSSHGVRIEIAFDPLDSLMMYATGDNSFDRRFYVSTNGGTAWSTRSYLQIAPATIIVDWNYTSRIYVFATPFRSEDAGFTWVRSDSGMPSGWWYWSSAIDPHKSSTLYMSTTLGVYRTTNRGRFWQKLEGSEALQISSRGFFIDAVAATLYVGTGHGLYSSNLPTAVQQIGEPPLAFHLYHNYPNPFNPTTTIKYTLPQKVFVSLSVYDVLGREVRTLVQEQQDAGIHSVEFRGDGLTSGVYFYKVTAGTRALMGKAVLIK